MAKRELSNTLRNLKFMQRGAPRVEESKKEEEVKPSDGDFFAPLTFKKCVVITEGDPHPGAVIGRMSFQSFNPSIDKMNETAANPSQPEASVSSSGGKSRRTPFRENPSSRDGNLSNEDRVGSEATADLKRKQSDVESKPQYPNKSPKNINGAQVSSQGSSKEFKKPKQVDWSVLKRPSKSKQKK